MPLPPTVPHAHSLTATSTTAAPTLHHSRGGTGVASSVLKHHLSFTEALDVSRLDASAASVIDLDHLDDYYVEALPPSIPTALGTTTDTTHMISMDYSAAIPVTAAGVGGAGTLTAGGTGISPAPPVWKSLMDGALIHSHPKVAMDLADMCIDTKQYCMMNAEGSLEMIKDNINDDDSSELSSNP